MKPNKVSIQRPGLFALAGAVTIAAALAAFAGLSDLAQRRGAAEAGPAARATATALSVKP